MADPKGNKILFNKKKNIAQKKKYINFVDPILVEFENAVGLLGLTTYLSYVLDF
jgi:hypothetical protein